MTDEQAARLRFLQAYEELGPGGLTLEEQKEIASLRCALIAPDTNVIEDINLSIRAALSAWTRAITVDVEPNSGYVLADALINPEPEYILNYVWLNKSSYTSPPEDEPIIRVDKYRSE